MPSMLDKLISGERFTLKLKSSDPIAELFVIDGAFNVVAEGAGDLAVKLPVGVYKLRQKVGLRVADRVIFLNRDLQEETFDPLDVDSAVPAAPTKEHSTQTRSERRDQFDLEFWRELCTSALASTIIESGTHSEITLLCHLDNARWYSSSGKSSSEDELFSTFDLLDANGDSVVSGPVEIGPDQLERGCYALTVKVDPGVYYLTLYAPVRSTLVRLATQQSIVASLGWQTRIYGFLLPSEDENVRALQLDSARISINMAHVGEAPPFDRMRLIETARQALVDGQYVDFADRRRMLVDKFDDPMLGLFAAHIILQQRRRQGHSLDRNALPEVLHTVSENLQMMLSQGGLDAPMHPDVATLLVHLGKSDAELTISHPPMLLASWRLLLAAESESEEDQNLIQIDSDVERISTHVLSSQPWMRWEAPRATGKAWQVLTKVRRGIGQLLWEGRLEVMPENLERVAHDLRTKAVFNVIADELSNTSEQANEDLKPDFFDTAAERFKAVRKRISKSSEDDPALRARLSQRLNLPRNKIRHILHEFQTRVLDD